MKTRTYAREITKDYLIKCGVENVTEDGLTVVVKGKPINFNRAYSGQRPYDNVQLYDTDLRMSVPKEERKSYTGQFRLGVHIINYVWNVADKPAGYVVDHIDNNSLNNHVSNLQLLTPRENVNKEKERPLRVVKMPKYITEEKINTKLAYYTDLYEQAKQDKDADKVHKLRSYISQWRAKQRMFLENPELYTKPVEVRPEHECHARAAKRKELKKEVDRAHRFYQEVKEAYGEEDEITYKYWGEWKLAVAEYYGFCKENKKDN